MTGAGGRDDDQRSGAGAAPERAVGMVEPTGGPEPGDPATAPPSGVAHASPGLAGTPERPATPPSPPPSPPAPGLWPRVLAVVAVVVIGVAAAWATGRDAAHQASQREELAAEQTGNLAVSTVRQLEAAISGVSGLPDRAGRVEQGAFTAYAVGAVAESPLESLAFAPVVRAADRGKVEAAIGRPIRDSPQGPRSGPRPGFLPVQWVVPSSSVTRQLIGLDLAVDPVRKAAVDRARDTGATVISGTVPSQPTGRPAVFLVHAVYRPGLPAKATTAQRRRAVVGYVTTGMLGDSILATLADQTHQSLGIRVEDMASTGAGPLVETDPPPDHGVTVVRDVAGRQWRITVDDHQPATTAAPWWILLGTAVLALTLAGLAVRARRQERQVARHVGMVERLAGLGRTLAAAESVADVARIVDADLPAVVDARSATLGLVDRQAGTIRLHFGPNVPDPDFTTRYGEIPIDVPVPLARAVREATPVILHSDDDWRAQAPPDVAADATRTSLGATACWPVTDASGDVVATVGVSWGRPGPIDELALASVATLAEMCGQTLGRAGMADLVRRDAATSRLLAGLAEAAATAGTVDQVTRTLADRAADVAGARSAHIGLLDGDGSALTVVHHDSLEPAIAERHERQPLDEAWPLVAAYRTGAPVLLPDLATVAERFPTVADDVRSAGLQAVACVPLLDAARAPIGALGLAWTSPHAFDDVLVDTLRTTADLCASSIGRARATDLAQARATALATLAGQLSASRSFDDVGAAIVDAAPAALGADYAIVGVVDGDQLRMLAPSGPGLDQLTPYTDLDLTGDFPALVALRRRQLVTFSDLTAVPEPLVAADLAAMGLHAGACAPLVGADGEALGVLSVLWSSPPSFDDALIAGISTVADLCGQSAERARLFDAEHRVRRDLQARVLPRIPVVPPLEVASRYQPAAPSVGMGGDWYDGIALDGDRLCLVLGDVTGHGVEAIAVMTQIRTVVHTLAAGGMALPEILTRTSASLQREGWGYATLVMAVIDQALDTVSFVTAGHPPPLLRRPDGRVDVLAAGHHSVLGVDLAARAPGHAPFPPGSTLIAYTDGLIERRDTTIDVSIRQLADRVAALDEQAPDAMADLLLADSASAPRADDVALVVAHRPGAPG